MRLGIQIKLNIFSDDVGSSITQKLMGLLKWHLEVDLLFKIETYIYLVPFVANVCLTKKFRVKKFTITLNLNIF